MTRDTDVPGTAEADDDQRPDVLPDGGSEERSSSNRSRGVRLREEAVDDVALDPWGSSAVSDYRKLFEQFGIEEFDALLPEVPDPHYLMRRGVIFGHRDYRPVLDAMREDEPFAALSGFMPTGDPHIGHKLVFDELIWHQERGGDVYGLIADLEAHSARGLSWDEIDEHARDYLLSLLALGFDPEEGELYRQSANRAVQDLAFELGAEANFSELQAIYGFDGETDVSHMQSVVTQMADILYPQLEEPKPTVIPVGPDQDPHVRLARDLASRMRFFKVVEACFSEEFQTEIHREISVWLSDEIERAFLENVEKSPPEDIAGGTLEYINRGQAAILLNDIREHLLHTRASNDLDFDVNRLVGLEHDYSEQDWENALEALTPFENKPSTVKDSAELDSLISHLNENKMEPFRKRTRFFNLSDKSGLLEDLVDALAADDRNLRRYSNHADVFDMSPADADEFARAFEVDHGGYGFRAPSSIYHRFMTGLTGGKMSSSIPASHISLLDEPETGYEKVKSATTAGRETAEKQRELGGEADKCPVYELYAYLLAGDDDGFAKEVYDECVGGERLCGDCKEQAALLMREFLAEHQEKREEAEELLEELDFELDSRR